MLATSRSSFSCSALSVPLFVVTLVISFRGGTRALSGAPGPNRAAAVPLPSAWITASGFAAAVDQWAHWASVIFSSVGGTVGLSAVPPRYLQPPDTALPPASWHAFHAKICAAPLPRIPSVKVVKGMVFQPANAEPAAPSFTTANISACVVPRTISACLHTMVIPMSPSPYCAVAKLRR